MDSGEGGVEGSGYAAEIIVAGRVGPVDAYADPFDPGFAQFAGDFFREQRAACGQDRPQAGLDGIVDDIEDVGAQERLAAGEDDDRFEVGGDIVQDAFYLVQAEFSLTGDVLGGSTAMFAAEIAPPGDFPGDEARGKGVFFFCGGVMHVVPLELIV